DRHPFLWDGSTLTNLVPSNGRNYDEVVAVNDMDQVLAYSADYRDLILYQDGNRNVVKAGPWWYNLHAIDINHVGQILYAAKDTSAYDPYHDLFLFSPEARKFTTGLDE